MTFSEIPLVARHVSPECRAIFLLELLSYAKRLQSAHCDADNLLPLRFSEIFLSLCWVTHFGLDGLVAATR